MKLMRIMPAALLLTLSLGAFAQDDDELADASAEEESVEVLVPTNRWEKPIFHRVLIGYTGTFANYSNNKSPRETKITEENYYLSGVSLGWLTDLRLVKTKPFYIELGTMFTYHTGHYDGKNFSKPNVRYTWHSRINAFSLTIPITVNYQFKDIAGVDGLTLAPFAGVYGRFNFIADRRETMTTENYSVFDGVETITYTDVKTQNKSLKVDNNNGRDGWMNGRNHVGKLLQVGAQVGANAYYKRYSFGISYMYDITPFAKHSSPEGTGSTGCDMKISTNHNFAITVGYCF